MVKYYGNVKLKKILILLFMSGLELQRDNNGFCCHIIINFFVAEM